MRFRSLSSTAALTLALVKLLTSLSVEADNISDIAGYPDRSCTFPPQVTDTSCSYRSFSSCSTCAGQTRCCSESNSYYGTCDDISNRQCPDGNDAICSGAQCSPGLSCKFANCPDFAEFCWGTTVCNGALSCSNLQGLFCSGEKSNSREFYVCCSKAHLNDALTFGTKPASGSAVAMNSTNSSIYLEYSLIDAGKPTMNIMHQRLLIEESVVLGKFHKYYHNLQCLQFYLQQFS